MSSIFNINKKPHFLYYLIFFSLINHIYSSLKFNIPNNRDKCFSEELFKDGTLLIRYDLKGIESIKKGHQEKVLKNIKLFVKGPTGKNLHELYLINRKGKFAMKVEKEGIYKICARYYKTWSVPDLPKDVLLGIKLRNDYEYKEIENTLLSKDVEDFEKQIYNLKKKVMPSISSSKKEIDEEDKMAKAIISTSNLYFILTFIQLILIFVIVIYQIFNLRRFLASKKLI